MDDAYSLFPEDCFFEPLSLYPEITNLNSEVISFSPSEIREVLELGTGVPVDQYVEESAEELGARLDDINEFVLQYLDPARDFIQVPGDPGLDFISDTSQDTIEVVAAAPGFQELSELDQRSLSPVALTEEEEETRSCDLNIIPSESFSDSDSGWKDQEKSIHTCVGCGRKYKDYQKYLSHKEGHLDGSRVCPVCNKVYASSVGVRLHTQRMHQKEKNSNPEKLPRKRTRRPKDQNLSRKQKQGLPTNRRHHTDKTKNTNPVLNKIKTQTEEPSIFEICEENIRFYELNSVEFGADEAILSPFKIMDDKRSYLLLHHSDDRGVKNEDTQEITKKAPSLIHNMLHGETEDETIRKDVAGEVCVPQETPDSININDNCSYVRKKSLSPFVVYEETADGVIEDNIHVSQEYKENIDSVRLFEEKLSTYKSDALWKKRDEDVTEDSCDSDVPLRNWKQKKAIALLFSSKLRRSKIQKSITYVDNKKTPVVEVSTSKPVDNTKKDKINVTRENRLKSVPQKQDKNTNTFACEFCERHFKLQEQFIKHMINHENPRLSCQTCKKVFASVGSLNIHQKLHQRQYKCELCTLTYDRVSQLETHIKKHAKAQQNTSENSTTVQQQNETKTPNNKQNNQENSTKMTKINNFMRVDKFKRKQLSGAVEVKSNADYTKVTVKNQVCEICSKRFDRVGDLKRHYIEHVAQQQASSTSGSVVCDCCNASFVHLDQYKAHLRWRAGLTLYTCSLCDKTFSNSSNFSKHKKVHDNVKFKCGVCAKKFITRKMLILHLEFHEKTGVIQCPECQKQVYSMSMLKKHLKLGHKKKDGYKKYGKSSKNSRKRRFKKHEIAGSTREVISRLLSPTNL